MRQAVELFVERRRAEQAGSSAPRRRARVRSGSGAPRVVSAPPAGMDRRHAARWGPGGPSKLARTVAVAMGATSRSRSTRSDAPFDGVDDQPDHVAALGARGRVHDVDPVPSRRRRARNPSSSQPSGSRGARAGSAAAARRRARGPPVSPHARSDTSHVARRASSLLDAIACTSAEVLRPDERRREAAAGERLLHGADGLESASSPPASRGPASPYSPALGERVEQVDRDGVGGVGGERRGEEHLVRESLRRLDDVHEREPMRAGRAPRGRARARGRAGRGSRDVEPAARAGRMRERDDGGAVELEALADAGVSSAGRAARAARARRP